jgi:serine/threonine protein kinase
MGYTIIGNLPTGGSGAKLYVAQPNDGAKRVVIKCFDITSGSQLPQIIRESRALESSKKLGLIIEHHLEDHRFWYVMPYHAGEHLGVVTNKLHEKSNPLSEIQLQTVLFYELALLQTLQEYHNAGLWHKDVKPDNIIIHGGTAHLVDLGLVTPLGSAMTLTTHGTEYFRDPELVRQANRGVKVHQVDGSKFDVYGAGAVLYFMLENTFPAQGGLSSFNKKSPESLRWIVRRAMADYDKRYASIADMLQDVEAVLSGANLFGVRPADLPSMGGEPPKGGVRRLPPKSTPSTGGGPFPAKTYNTKPIGLLALFASIVVGVVVVMNSTNQQVQDPVEMLQQTSVLDFPKPSGRVLVISDVAVLHDDEVQRISSNALAQLDVAGWDIFTDTDTEARIRRWLPTEITTPEVDGEKIQSENLAGILVLKLDENGNVEFKFVDSVSATVWTAVQYISGRE